MITRRLLVASVLALSLALIPSTSALYSKSDDVVELTSSNFHKLVVKSDEVWMVEFYAPWCGHCKSLAPEWKQLAKALKGIVKVGAVDMTAHQDVGAPYQIQGFPTIKVFGANKDKPSDYNGGRTAKELADAAVKEVKSAVNERLGVKKSNTKKESRSDVVSLTDRDFDEKVLQSGEVWMVEFFAPWCGHCKRLEPEWAQAASELKGFVNLGAVDATVEQSLAQKYGIQGYPTIKIFPGGQDYQGPREAPGIISYGMDIAEKLGGPPTIPQILSQKDFEKTCKDTVNICVITLLPHILDSSAEERNAHLDVIRAASKSFRGRPLKFLWSEGGSQFEWEDRLGLTFGFPAVVAMSVDKNASVTMRAAFNEGAMKSFIDGVLIGKERTSTMPVLPKLQTVEEWDGKDGQLPDEDNWDDEL